MTDKEKRIKVSMETDIIKAIFEVQKQAEKIGFKETVQCMIATATSELARNILVHAKRGEITARLIGTENGEGIEIIAEDNAPGIEDLATALKDGFSTKGTLGLGLAGAKRLMDEFIFDYERIIGTKITVRKWLKK